MRFCRFALYSENAPYRRYNNNIVMSDIERVNNTRVREHRHCNTWRVEGTKSIFEIPVGSQGQHNNIFYKRIVRNARPHRTLRNIGNNYDRVSKINNGLGEGRCPKMIKIQRSLTITVRNEKNTANRHRQRNYLVHNFFFFRTLQLRPRTFD